MKNPIIAIQDGKLACFDGPDCVRKYEPFTNQVEAIDEAIEWFKCRGCAEGIRIVRPRVTSMRMSFTKYRRRVPGAGAMRSMAQIGVIPEPVDPIATSGPQTIH